MKDKLKTNALIFLISLVIIYLFSSFAVWDLNPSHWSPELRGSFAFITPCLCMLAVAFSNID